jgi:putative transposase
LRTNTEYTYKNIIAFDQGVRVFLTGFDTEGNGFKFRKYGINVLQKKLLRVDKIQSTMKQKSNQKTFDYDYKRRKNIRRLFCKFKNQVRDAHHNISFYARGMMKLQVVAVRKKLVCSYYKLKQIIQAKAKRYNCLTVTCTEHYTSQTCSECGSIDNKQGSNKIYHYARSVKV